jgi:hypothetical protein
MGWFEVSGTFVNQKEGATFLPAFLGAFMLISFLAFSEELLSRGYQLINVAEGLGGKWLNQRVAALTSLVLSSVLFGLFHLTNNGASLISTISAMMGGVLLGLGFLLTRELAMPIGIHIAWNFFQANVFGFIVSGENLSTATIISTRVAGPAIWVGDSFGPESGLLAIGAIMLGCVFVLAWVRFQYGRIKIHPEIGTYDFASVRE